MNSIDYSKTYVLSTKSNKLIKSIKGKYDTMQYDEKSN